MRFVRRMHRMRMLGVVLTAVPIAAFLSERDTPPWLWVALAANVLLWPQLAWWFGLRARRPTNVELWSLTLDAAAGGFWVALMQLGALPSVLVASILLSDRYAAGGWLLVRRAVPAFVAALMITLLARGGAIDFGVSERVTLACLPLLAVYPLALSILSRRLSVRVAHQGRELASFERLGVRGELPTRQQLNVQVSAFVRIPAVDESGAALMLLRLDQAAAMQSSYAPAVEEAVLAAVAEIVKDAARDNGMPARWAGSEFALLLPRMDPELATALGELMRMRVRQVALDEYPELQCTASVGVAIWPGHWNGPGDWVKGAEGAMQHARRLGGDCVYVAKPPPSVALS
ncbi:MASE2 domain-containing protein [Pseudoxanthomonas sp.]|uniref:MASE2 domain-containing protein n=1 Tax=Pseudoxanthomonas sp. TaxID=1871049 RepID=UPI0026260941|nr:MASE2 domain-containing protein [Pseudoxanthomonas sp.]WDS35415.1 MAG: MASE2 domain-containing protein [Pseudoxanthomonas sp.]